MPYHKILDGLYEEAKGPGATGTTRRGIGPVFADKVSYNGIRWSDFASEMFEERLKVQLELKNKIITALGGENCDTRKFAIPIENIITAQALHPGIILPRTGGIEAE